MDKAKRKAIIAGNWKMNKTASEAAVLVDELVPAVQDAGCEVVICTPYTDLVKKKTGQSCIELVDEQKMEAAVRLYPSFH